MAHDVERNSSFAFISILLFISFNDTIHKDKHDVADRSAAMDSAQWSFLHRVGVTLE